MSKEVHDQKHFENADYTEKDFSCQEFYDCTFLNCNFTESNLSKTIFEDCSFENCNFSMTRVEQTSFKNINFKGCKLLGMNFSSCNPFMLSFNFTSCALDYAVFYGTKLKKTKFKECSLREVDFTIADLSFADFSDSDLLGTVFSNTILEKADFRTARNFSINPEINEVKKAKFSVLSLRGLLNKYQLDIEILE